MLKTFEITVAFFLLIFSLNACEQQPRIGDQVGVHYKEVRPTDGDGWFGNGYGDDINVEHWDTPSGRFRVHFTREGVHAVPTRDDDNDGVPDFAQEFGLTFDHVLEKYQEAGFREPLSDELYHDTLDYGGDGRFDVYLQNQGAGADGYLVTEQCTNTIPPQCAGYMVVENDFVGYNYSSPQEGMEVLASHEFFHAIQNAYRQGLITSFSEGTAVWGTEYIYPDTADFDHFVSRFFENIDRPIDDTPQGMADLFAYTTAIWPRFLSEHYSISIVSEVLTELSDVGSSPTEIDAVEKVLKNNYNEEFAVAFAEFGLWNLLTGSRANSEVGYQNAKDYPEVEPKVESQAHPYRISGEIAYLSSRYFKLDVSSGERITVTSERPEPALMITLVTGSWDAPTISRMSYGETSVDILAQGPIYLVATSTVKTGSKSIPYSMAVRGAIETNSDDGGGCSMNSNSQPIVLFIMMIALFILRSLKKSSTLILIMIALLTGCSDDDGVVNTDAGSDGTSTTTPLSLGEFFDVEANEQGVIEKQFRVSGDEELMFLLLSHDQTPLKNYDYTINYIDGLERKKTSDLNQKMSIAPKYSLNQCRFVKELQHLLAVNEKPLWQGYRPLKHLDGATPPPAIGDKKNFKVGASTIEAEAIAVNDTAVFWIDKTTQPLATIDDDALKELSEKFSTLVVPRERIYFGSESDVDGDGLIHVLLSALVNAQGAVAYVSPCDLVDPSELAGCPASNMMELIYLTPPSAISPPYNTPTAMLETVAHEFQHNIYFYRKYLLNKNMQKNENPYITEGLSHLAQDLTGLAAGNLYVQLATLNEIDMVSLPNALNGEVSSYFPQPADGIMRGAGYFILRYLFDRAGGDELDSAGTPVDKGGIAFLHQLIDQPELGVEGYLKASGLSYSDLADGFWTTIALSNRKAGGVIVNEDYSYLPTTTDPLTERVRGVDLYRSFHASQMLGPKTQDYSSVDGKLRPGGAEFIVLKVTNAGASSVKITTSAEAKAKLRVMRIR